MAPQIWVVTGCSSGVGRELVKTIIARGDRVVATARTLSKIEDLKVEGAEILQLDVTAPQSELDRKAEDAIAFYGKVDVLVNNAAYVHFGTVEDTSLEQWLAQFNTNVFGTINVSRSFLPHFRSRRDGKIVMIGSSNGWEGLPTIGTYCASKFALRGVYESLRQEVGHLGIGTFLIEAGSFRTEVLSDTNATYHNTKIKDYEPMITAGFEVARATHGRQSGDPAKLAERIVDIVKMEGLASRGRKEGLQTAIPIGPDAYAVVKAACERTLKTLEDWKDVIESTDY